MFIHRWLPEAVLARLKTLRLEERGASAEEAWRKALQDFEETWVVFNLTLRCPAPLPLGMAPTWPTTCPSRSTWADEGIHEQVGVAVEEWLAKAGFVIDEREQSVISSWFRPMRATAKTALNSETAHDVAMTAVHAAEARPVIAQNVRSPPPFYQASRP
jgi:hypothetical protein